MQGLGFLLSVEWLLGAPLPTPTHTYIIQCAGDHLEPAPEIAQDLMTFQIRHKNHLFDKGLEEGSGCVVSEGFKQAILQFWLMLDLIYYLYVTLLESERSPTLNVGFNECLQCLLLK